MASTSRNSMAAAMSAFMGIVIWLAVIIGVLAAAMIGMGLAAALNGGEMAIPGGSVYAEDMAPGRLVAALAGLVIMLPIVIYICLQLRRILETLAQGDPFVPENAPRLSRIAIAVAVMELARNLAGFLVGLLADMGPGDGFRLSLNLAAWAAVAVLVVLSQVFREGTRLREEEKMTI